MSKRLILSILIVGLLVAVAGCVPNLFQEQTAEQASAGDTAPTETMVPPSPTTAASVIPTEGQSSNESTEPESAQPEGQQQDEMQETSQAPESAQPEGQQQDEMQETSQAPESAQPVERQQDETEETSRGPEAPILLDPPDEFVGTVIDLVWQWMGELQEDEWFELQIWPDTPEAEPEAYKWLKMKEERVTSAHLLPGRYRWRVAVVRGQEDCCGEEMTPWSDERVFIIAWPAIKDRLNITPVPPTLIPTNTPRPPVIWWPSPGPSPTPTETLIAPTATETVPGSAEPTPTETLQGPTATFTPGGYPAATPTNTGVVPTATNTPGSGAPTATFTPAPKFTDTPPPPTATDTGPTVTNEPPPPTATTVPTDQYP
jgi:hypothetical protein